MKEAYLPIHLIPRGADVAIYGAGKIGRLYCDENAEINWCNIVCAFDKNHSSIHDFPVKVNDPENVADCPFDVIIIARSSIAGQLEIDSIYDYLVKKGVKPSQIVSDFSCCLWSSVDTNVLDEIEESENRKTDLQIAFLPSGAMGDSVISLRLYEEIVKLVGQGSIDVYSKGSYTEAIFYNQPMLRKIYHDIYGLRSPKWREYDLVIRAEFEPVIQYVKINRIKKESPILAEHLLKLYQYQTMNCSEMPIGAYTSGIRLNRARFWGMNRYTLLGCNGIFDIKDQRVNLLLNDSFINEYNSLGLGKNYITFSYGAGGTLDKSRHQTKSWPKLHYEKCIKLLKKDYPKLKIVQLGGSGDECIKGADEYLMGRSIEVIEFVLRDSLLHLDCDSGLCHIATQLGTKCFVVFGPTPVWFFGYKQNVNFTPEVCGECKDLIADWYFRCLNYDEPECMKSIRPEKVYKEMKKYISIRLD